MNLLKAILLSFLWLLSTAIHGQKNALEYHIGIQKTKIFLKNEGSFKPVEKHFNPRLGIHYYHRLNRILGIKTGLQLFNVRTKRSSWSNFYTIDGLSFYVEYDIIYDLILVNIPINLRIDLNQGNPHFFMETGLSLNTYWRERTKFDPEDYVPPEIILPNYPNGFQSYDGVDQKIGALANLNFGVRYDLNEKSALIFQTVSAFDFSRIDGIFNDRYILYYGLQVGYTHFL